MTITSGRSPRPVGWILCALVLWTLAGGGEPAAGAPPTGEWVSTGPPSGTATGTREVIAAPGGPLLFDLGTGTVQEYRLDTGTWEAGGALHMPRSGATITLLPSGQVLLAGGGGGAGMTAELYDPTTGTSAPTGAMHFARTRHQATLLNTGKVLVSGGVDASNQLVGTAELYDPATGIWSPTGGLINARARHAAALLPGGRVLVAGGEGLNGALASAELYDPATGTWVPTGAMEGSRARLLAGTLPGGGVLVVGPASSSGGATEYRSQIYDPAAGAWTAAARVTGGFRTVLAGLVIVPDGTALVAVGTCGGLVAPCTFGTALTFDAQAGQWNAAPHPISGQSCSLSMLPLTDGRVLLVACDMRGSPSAQLFRPDNASPRLTVSPISFGQTRPGVPVHQTVNLQNTGGATLSGTATAAEPFRVVSGSPFTISAGMSAPLVVEFAPSEFGPISGSVSFVSNGNWLTVEATGGGGVRISGRITGTAGEGIGGVSVNLAGGSTATTTTDATGQYAFFVSPNNGYTVTPAATGTDFTPVSRSVTITTGDVGAVDFEARPADPAETLVEGFYEELLGRHPDPDGLAGWNAYLRGHCDAAGVSVLARGFLESEEFRTARPLTVNGLVAALYRALLARDPEPAGLTAWAASFRQRRLEAAVGFVRSAEFRQRMPDPREPGAVAAFVTRLYRDLLDREPDAAGFDAWASYLRASGDMESAAVGFISSGEFEARALAARGYVTVLYEGLLGRAPDPGGREAWEAWLRQHLIDAVNGGFIPSAEFQERLPHICGR